MYDILALAPAAGGECCRRQPAIASSEKIPPSSVGICVFTCSATIAILVVGAIATEFATSSSDASSQLANSAELAIGWLRGRENERVGEARRGIRHPTHASA